MDASRGVSRGRTGPWRVPFNVPTKTADDHALVAEAIASGCVGGGGPYTARCQARLEQMTGAPRALLTTSGTHALEMAALLLNLQPGDEVVVPAFTYVSSAAAFVMRGARPIFCDVRSDTLNLDERRLAALVTPRTKAIVVVHYAGVACEMDTVLAIAAAHRIAVIEDNAHGLFAAYRHRPLGTLGTLAALSFHETKNISCGEGGALLINDPRLIERAEIVRDKGTDRSQFLRGQVDRYTWRELGSSYAPSDVLAALLLAQIQNHDTIQRRRRSLWERYASGLGSWAAVRGIALPAVPAHVEQAFHLFYLLMPSAPARDRILTFLAERSIHATFHYQPLHLSSFARQHATTAAHCPVAEDVSARLVRLPFFTSISDEEIDFVLDNVCRFD